MGSPLCIGLISDTHGLLREEAVAALRGCERILHAGDIGSLEVVERLREVAPVTAIRGNVDVGGWVGQFPAETMIAIGGASIYLLHDLKALCFEPAAEGIDVVVSGHSHRPRVEVRDGVLFINPGSAGPRRFRLPVCVAHLRVGKALDVQHIDLL